MGCLFFDFPPPGAFDFDQKLTQNVAQIILYYHVAKQFLPYLNWFIMCFRFKNMFWKNSCFRFWWKTYTKRWTNNYVISCVKRLPQPALCGWSSAFSFRIWLENGRMPCKQKYLIKTMAIKIPILILFRFRLLCYLSPFSIVAASFFNFIGPCSLF